MFITFEGIDGSGKTTQIKKIYNWLISQNKDVILTSEPNLKGIHSNATDILQSLSEPKAQTCFINALRIEHITKIIEPARKEMKIVLCDRFIESTICYQGYGFGQDIDFIKRQHKECCNDYFPDITYFLDISIDEARERMYARGEMSKFDKMDKKTVKKIIEGYWEETKKSNYRIIKIDARQNEEDVFQDIISDLQTKI